MNSNDKKHLFEQYLNKLLDEIMCIETYFELYVHIYDKRVTNIDELNIAPCFWGNVINAFLSNTIISLARIYENYNGRDRSDRNLNTFLNFVKQCTEIFPRDKETLTKYRCNHEVNEDLIKKHREMIQDHKEKLDKLFYWRDKHYAHFDKKYFLESDSLRKDSELTIRNIRELIRLAETILNDYSVAYSGTCHSVTPTNLFDVDNIIDILYNHNRSV